jgi:hypothetical protein
MACACATLPNAFYGSEAPAGFLDSLEEQACSDWRRLCICPECGTPWAVDEWDKFAVQVACRVGDPAVWPQEIERARRTLLLQSRGGLTDQVCMWKGCDRKRVKGSAYCLEHLFDTGARR